jgi:hypothetical protein
MAPYDARDRKSVATASLVANPPVAARSSRSSASLKATPIVLNASAKITFGIGIGTR